MTKENIGSKRERMLSTSISFKNADADSEDEIQMSLAPYIQTYLAHSSSSNSCGCLPVPFERAARHSWIHPCFDSDILEGQFKTSSFKQFTKRFRYALIYIMTVSVMWLIYLICHSDINSIKFELIIFSFMFLIASLILGLTYCDVYRAHCSIIAAAAAVFLVVSSLCFSVSGGTSTVSHFTMICYVILVIYTIVPLLPYISLIICVLFSILSEAIIILTQHEITTFNYGVVIRVLCLLCVHIVGFHILIMTHVRVRGTFMKVGQRLLVRRQLEMEKQLKEKMIHSVMPPKVANWLLSGENGEVNSIKNSNQQDIGSLFRPFNMSRMDNVSILFADIVGFTKMSSNKNAEEIVDILNDLFERFDDLCLMNGCEKISTLGDCYYCVSGCPDSRPDHAKCCVEMGLGMIDAIQEFDLERGEDVNMRVGVHTGTVLCGVVGTRRFKFDVWSNDVTFANKLESTGLPGRVHISEQTAKFLQGIYVFEDYEDLQGVKTYLIQERMQNSPKELGDATDVSAENPGPLRLPEIKRTRLYSYNTPTRRPHYLSLITEARSKFTSLPNVLGSNHRLSDLSDRVRTSKWFSFSRLKKETVPNGSVTEVASCKNDLGSAFLQETGSSMCRLDIPKRHDLKNEEEMSLCPSVNSRKDSGIRSTSRRSSIQQQIYLMNGMAQGELLTHRVSGYYTSSQSSIARSESDCENEVPRPTRGDNLGSCFYSLRKQSDLQLIRCVQDISRNSYFVKVPLHQLTLFFKDKETEQEYRSNAHNIHEKQGDSPATLSTSRFNTYFDILVSALVLIATTVALYILDVPSPYFVAASVTALLVESTALLFCLLHLSKTNSDKFNETTKHFSKKILHLFSKWYPWHVFGGILVSLPILIILINIVCHSWTHLDTVAITNHSFNFSNADEYKLPNVELRDHYYTFLILIGLIHFCNFTQLNFFMKSILALITGIFYITVVSNENCQYHNKNYVSPIFISQFVRRNVFVNETENTREFFLSHQVVDIVRNLTTFDAQKYHSTGLQFLNSFYSNVLDEKFFVSDGGYEFLSSLNSSKDALKQDVWVTVVLQSVYEEFLTYDVFDTILNVFVVLILVILLNREFEINYRLSYYCNTESNKDKLRVQSMKNQADWLLENIIPKHVSVELKNRAKYCENHSNVGIIFASIVNFNKLYDETYSGGKEYLRVLNELISDFDELLNLEEFKNVDKIKTIGSTFMGATGLNPEQRKKNKTEYEHIFELIEFAIKMYKVVDVFNHDLLGFNLILRIGFNIGEVTAGVIGSSKLFYDIWGDAVNVASRMDSTGVDGRIQVPYSCLSILSERYHFEPRGSVYVKGKGDILVYLLKE